MANIATRSSFPRFLDLPFEVRRLVYRKIFRNTKITIRDTEALIANSHRLLKEGTISSPLPMVAIKGTKFGFESSNEAQLVFASKQCYAEALPEFWTACVFVVEVDPYYEVFEVLSKARNICRQVQNLSVVLRESPAGVPTTFAKFPVLRTFECILRYDDADEDSFPLLENMRQEAKDFPKVDPKPHNTTDLEEMIRRFFVRSSPFDWNKDFKRVIEPDQAYGCGKYSEDRHSEWFVS